MSSTAPRSEDWAVKHEPLVTSNGAVNPPVKTMCAGVDRTVLGCELSHEPGDRFGRGLPWPGRRVLCRVSSPFENADLDGEARRRVAHGSDHTAAADELSAVLSSHVKSYDAHLG